MSLHLATIQFVVESPKTLNATISLFFQITGAAFVLLSIDSNLGILRNSSLLSELAAYWRRRPKFKRHTVAAVGRFLGSMTVSGKVRVIVKQNPGTLEDAVRYFEERIDELRKQTEEDFQDMRNEVSQKTQRLNDNIAELEGKLGSLRTSLDDVMVSDVKLQAFGAYLWVHGAVAGYFS